MDNIDIRAGEHFAKVLISLYILVIHQFQRLVEMLFIHITNRQQAGVAIPQMSSSHTTHPDYRFGNLITGGGIAIHPQHMPRDQSKGKSGSSCGRGLAQEFSSGLHFFSHFNHHKSEMFMKTSYHYRANLS
jgi:hypothetical protein